MSVFESMGNDTKIVGAVFVASTAAYFFSRHLDRKATEQAIAESPQTVRQIEVPDENRGVEPVNP